MSETSSHLKKTFTTFAIRLRKCRFDRTKPINLSDLASKHLEILVDFNFLIDEIKNAYGLIPGLCDRILPDMDGFEESINMIKDSVAGKPDSIDIVVAIAGWNDQIGGLLIKMENEYKFVDVACQSVVIHNTDVACQTCGWIHTADGTRWENPFTEKEHTFKYNSDRAVFLIGLCSGMKEDGSDTSLAKAQGMSENENPKRAKDVLGPDYKSVFFIHTKRGRGKIKPPEK